VNNDLNKQRSDLMKLITHHFQTPGISSEIKQKILEQLRNLEQLVREQVQLDSTRSD